VARTLHAYVDALRVGELAESNGVWSFAYAPQWLEAPSRYPLSPWLPLTPAPIVDSSSTRPVQWYFDNLLPEEGERALLAGDARVDVADAFALLACYGAESAGSITLVPEATPPADAGREQPLADAALQARIEALPRVSLAAGAPKRMSLAGAQHKLAVIHRDGALFEPVGATPSTHVLKPDHPDPDYPHTVANELFVMRLAARLGLKVPGVLRRYVPAPVYLVERFDREATAAGLRRLHLVDACQLLNLDRAYKYAEGSIERLAELARATTAPAVARIRLFEWLVFNLLVGNADAHLKNLSFVVSERGVAPAPAYDLVSVAAYETRAFGRTRWPETHLAWPILGAGTFAACNGALAIEAGVALGLARETAKRTVSRLAGRAHRTATALLADIVGENEALAAERPELAATLGGEVRMLRTITGVVVREMAERLGS
jgi:serine/threonine-protein kinase HipA